MIKNFKTLLYFLLIVSLSIATISNVNYDTSFVHEFIEIEEIEDVEEIEGNIVSIINQTDILNIGNGNIGNGRGSEPSNIETFLPYVYVNLCFNNISVNKLSKNSILALNSVAFFIKYCSLIVYS